MDILSFSDMLRGKRMLVAPNASLAVEKLGFTSAQISSIEHGKVSRMNTILSFIKSIGYRLTINDKGTLYKIRDVYELSKFIYRKRKIGRHTIDAFSLKTGCSSRVCESIEHNPNSITVVTFLKVMNYFQYEISLLSEKNNNNGENIFEVPAQKSLTTLSEEIDTINNVENLTMRQRFSAALKRNRIANCVTIDTLSKKSSLVCGQLYSIEKATYNYNVGFVMDYLAGIGKYIKVSKPDNSVSNLYCYDDVVTLIINARADNNLTQAEMAARMGCSRQQYFNIANKHTAISIDLFLNIILALNYSLSFDVKSM